MTTTPSATRSEVTHGLVVTWSTGLLLATLLGLGAAYARGEQFWLVFVVSSACFLGPCTGLAWLTVGAGRRVEIDARAEENVEARWIEKATSGALLDLLVAIALLLGAMSLLDLRLSIDGVLILLWWFAVVDAGLRYVLLRRRQS